MCSNTEVWLLPSLTGTLQFYHAAFQGQVFYSVNYIKHFYLAFRSKISYNEKKERWLLELGPAFHLL